MTFSQYMRRSYRWYEVDEIVRWKFKAGRSLRATELFELVQTPEDIHAVNMLSDHFRTVDAVNNYITNKHATL